MNQITYSEVFTKLTNPNFLTKDELSKYNKYTNIIFKDLIKEQQKAIGKIKVGCIVQAFKFIDNTARVFHFGGCNLHISDSFGDVHAEKMAIDHTIKERCYPTIVFVTSNSDIEDVLLCGSCRHYISEINESCNIVVFNPNGTIKNVSSINTCYPKHKNVKEKNKKFFDMCCEK